MRHVILTCKNHPHLRWQCKSIATSPQGGYNGARHIFFRGTHDDATGKDSWAGPECTCPARDLVLAPEEQWDSDCDS